MVESACFIFEILGRKQAEMPTVFAQRMFEGIRWLNFFLDARDGTKILTKKLDPQEVVPVTHSSACVVVSVLPLVFRTGRRCVAYPPRERD